MIIPQNNEFTGEQEIEVREILGEFNCTLKPIKGQTQTIYAILGDERHELMINRVEGTPTERRFTYRPQ